MPCPYHTLKILWTPVSTGVTIFYENIKNVSRETSFFFPEADVDSFMA